MKSTKRIAAQVALLGLCGSLAAAPMGTAFTYQGRLLDAGNPANGSYTIQFALFDAPSGGARVAGPFTNGPVGVTNGLFTAVVDFGALAFDGSARWLQVSARTNGASAFVDLSPRQPLTPAPYALYAPSAGSLSAGVNQTFTGTVSFSPASGPPFAVNNSNSVANLNADLLDGRHASSFWKLGGNAGTTSGVDFLGTADSQSLDLRVFGQSALRLEYAATPLGVPYPNLIAGSSGAINSLGSSIGGGAANQIAGAADFSFMGGGHQNAIRADSHHSFLGAGYSGVVGTNAPYAFLGGGQGNAIYARHSFLGGGENNSLGSAAFHSFLGGGVENSIQTGAEESFLGGGYQNQILTDAAFAALGGGSGNVIGAEGGTIPGGSANWVNGLYSFAAGYRAKATLPGCFVWADAHAADFTSSAAHSFNVRATGGINFVTGIYGDGTPSSTISLRDGLGIALPAADAPMLTCGWDPFTSGPKTGLGRWGMFMEPFSLRIGIPAEDIGDRTLEMGKYFLDGSFEPIISFMNHNSGDWGGIWLSQNVTLGNNLFVWGDISNPSDRNLKENIVPVDPLVVLEKVAAMPVSEWSYKNRNASRHIGPMAQDFHAAFPLNTNDTSIPLLTANGVALAAIQGLNQKLETRNAALEKEVTELKAMVKALTEKVNGGGQ